MTVEITYNSWVALAEEIVRRDPEFVYKIPGEGSRCLYVHNRGENPEPGCIIGTMLWHLDIIVPIGNEGDLVTRLLDNLSSAGVISIPEEDLKNVFNFSSRLQNYQDSGASWENALARAKHEMT